MKLEDLFEKRTVNAYEALSWSGRPIHYARSDFNAWAKEARKRGERYFYCKPADPDNVLSGYVLSEPEYRWFFKFPDGLSEEEYQSLISGEEN